MSVLDLSIPPTVVSVLRPESPSGAPNYLPAMLLVEAGGVQYIMFQGGGQCWIQPIFAGKLGSPRPPDVPSDYVRWDWPSTNVTWYCPPGPPGNPYLYCQILNVNCPPKGGASSPPVVPPGSTIIGTPVIAAPCGPPAASTPPSPVCPLQPCPPGAAGTCGTKPPKKGGPPSSPPPPSPGPPPSPPPLLPPPPTLAGCDTSAYLTLPIPGSKEWCRVQGEILSAIKQIGINVFGFLSQELQSAYETMEKWKDSEELKNCGWAHLLDCLVGAFKWLVGKIGSPVVYALHTMVCWLGNGAVRSDTCDPVVYASLAVLKVTWEAVKNSDFGVNGGVWAVLRLGGKPVIPLIDQSLEFLINAACPMHPPCPPEAIEAFLRNTVGTDQYECWMLMAGASPEVYQGVLESRREQLRTDEIIDFTRRQWLGNQSAWVPNSPYTANEELAEAEWQKISTAQMRNVGWIFQNEASNRYQLYDELPTITDHLHWLARNIDDLEYVARYHLLDGFSTPADIAGILGIPGYATLPQAAKRNFWATYGAELRAQGMRKIDAARHYAAHWLHASPTQMREFVYRLIPGRPLELWEAQMAQFLGIPAQPGDPAPPEMTFTADDFRRLLSEQDYSYMDVGWFMSTIYHVPALSYIRDMYRYGVIGDEELGLYHQKLGYSPADAERFVGVDRKIKARIRASESFGWTPSALSRSYGLGLITEKFYRQQMSRMGFSEEETSLAIDRSGKYVKERILNRALGRVITRTITQVSQSFSAGAIDQKTAIQAIQGLGVPEKQAAAIIQMETLRALTRLTSEVVRTVRAAYLKGKTTLDQAKNLLKQAAVVDDFIQVATATWQLEKIDSPKEMTLADIRRWVVEGLMTFDEAAVRLKNMGYKDPERQLILAELQQKVADAQAKAKANLAKQDAKAQAEAAKAVEQAQKAVKQSIDEVKRQMPPAKLLQWVREGIITVEDMAAQLQLYGFTPEAIRDWTSEAFIRSGLAPPGMRLPPRPTKPPKPKTLTQAEVRKMYTDGIIGAEEFVARLTAMGYDYADINELAQLAGRPLPGASG